MKYAVEMTSGGMIYMPTSSIQELSRFWETATMVLLMKWIYEASCWDGLSQQYDMHSKFHDNLTGIQVILRLLPQKSERLQCWYYWLVGFINMPLRWTQVAWYAHQVSLQYKYPITQVTQSPSLVTELSQSTQWLNSQSPQSWTKTTQSALWLRCTMLHMTIS
jgi:hypothetical protein